MEQLEKLDKIIIEDNLNLSADDIAERAQDILNDKSHVFGWQSCELRASPPSGAAAPGHRRFEFDIYGLPGESAGVESELNISKIIQKPKNAASPEVDV